MAWLNEWENDWIPFSFNHTTRAWPNPNEPRRFSPYWFPQWLGSVRPLMDYYVLRTTIDENPDIVLWSSIQTYPIGPMRFGGDTGVSPDGRSISVDVERFVNDVPGFQFPGIRWQWRYDRIGFADTVVADVMYALHLPDSSRIAHDFDLPMQSDYGASVVFSQSNWTPQLDTDYQQPLVPRAWHWQAVGSRTPIPNNPMDHYP